MERSVIRDSAVQPRRSPRISLRSIRATTRKKRNGRENPGHDSRFPDAVRRERSECCTADPGSLWTLRSLRSRVCSAPLRAALRPGNVSVQSNGSTFTMRWSWLEPTQNVTGVVELSTNTVRILVSDGIRYCTLVLVFGSSRTTRSVLIVEAQISPFLSKLA